jgi:hypothetical protein
LVLTPTSYQKLYATNEQAKTDYKAPIETLKTVCTNKTLLFIGCSLDDAELLAQILQQQTTFADGTGPHFALVHQAEVQDIERKLNGTNIKLITFTDFGPALLELVEHSVSFWSVKTGSKPTTTKEKPPVVTKMALFTASPLDQPQEYPALMKALKKVPCEIDHFALNISNLNSLTGYDYLFIASKVIKNQLMIEDEYLSNVRISFEELEEEVSNEETKGLFIFVDKLPNSSVLTTFGLPTLMVRHDDKKLSKLEHQLFNKQNPDFFEQGFSSSSNKLVMDNLAQKTKSKINAHSTKLPSNLDAKTVQSFVGRIDDLEQIYRKLMALEDHPGILTIKGAGGMGKTTTVKKLTVALAQRGHFPDGIHFVDCEFIPDCQRFVYEVASAYNLEQAQDVRHHIQASHEDESRLIILDNLETVLQLDDVEAIKDFMAFICDYASVVTTSRELVQVEGETFYEMRQLTGDEAVKLFIANTGFKVNEKESALLRVDILENLLDNNPLAITLVTGNMPPGKKLDILKKDMEDFKRLSNSNKQQKKETKKPSIITDKVIKVLANKSTFNYLLAKALSNLRNRNSNLALERFSAQQGNF